MIVTPMGIPHSRLKISAMPENPVSGNPALTAKLSSDTATKNPPNVSIKKEMSHPFQRSLSIVCFIFLFPSCIKSFPFSRSAKKSIRRPLDMIRKCSFLF